MTTTLSPFSCTEDHLEKVKYLLNQWLLFTNGEANNLIWKACFCSHEKQPKITIWKNPFRQIVALLSFPFMLFVEFDKLQSVETTLMSHYWTLGVIYEQIFSQPFVLCDWMSLRLKRIDEEIASICLYSSFLCFLLRSICVTSYITMWKPPCSCTFVMFAKHSVHLSWYPFTGSLPHSPFWDNVVPSYTDRHSTFCLSINGGPKHSQKISRRSSTGTMIYPGYHSIEHISISITFYLVG